MKTLKYLSLTAATAIALTGAAHAQDKPLTRADVETIISEYLVQNPDVVVEALESFRAKQEEAMQADAQKGVQKHWEKLISKDAPSTGASADEAAVTVVEFYDYNCGYCKRALTDVQHILDQHKDVRVVFHEMPILSPASRIEAKWSLAAHRQGKFFEYHTKLMGHKGSKPESVLRALAEEVGMDVEQLRKDVNDPAIQDEIETAMTMAQEIGIRGTPAFIVNGKLYPGYLGQDGMNMAIEEAKKANN